MALLTAPLVGDRTVAFGRLEGSDSKRHFMFGDLVNPVVATPAAIPVAHWNRADYPGMSNILGNDKTGDCVLEGSMVTAPNLHKAFKGKYDGPAARITLESGKRIAVTANHPMITPRGSIPAKFLKDGDYLIGACGPEVFPNISIDCRQIDIDHSPSSTQEIFSSFGVGRNPVRKIMPTAIDLHGDGKFINGYVDVVGADSLLRRELDTSLRQPHAKTKVRSAGQLQSDFQGFGAAFLRRFRSFSAAFGDISFGSQRAALRYAHSGITKTDTLAHRSRFVSSRDDGPFKSSGINAELIRNVFHRSASHISRDRSAQIPISQRIGQKSGFSVRPEFYASQNYSTTDGAVADSTLVSNLLDAFPGMIALDRIVHVDVDQFTGHVFDFSTEQRWYMCDGIVNHNCTCAGIIHHLIVWLRNTDSKQPDPTVEDTLALYSAATGWDAEAPLDHDGNNPTDNGAELTTVLDYAKANGILPGGRNKITGYLRIDGTNLTHVRLAIQIFGGVYTGFSMSRPLIHSMQNLANGFLWDAIAKPEPNAGHCIYFPGYNSNELICDTWGIIGGFSNKAFQHYFGDAQGGEVYAIVSEDWLSEATKRSPGGFDLAQLNALLTSLA